MFLEFFLHHLLWLKVGGLAVTAVCKAAIVVLSYQLTEMKGCPGSMFVIATCKAVIVMDLWILLP